MNTKPLRQVLLLAVAAPLLAACTGSLPATSVIVTQPPATAASASTTSGGAAMSSATTTAVSPNVTVTKTGPTNTVTMTARATVTVAADDVRLIDSTSNFMSPSGRIACMMISPDDGVPTEFWVRCDYLDSDRAWTTPRPGGCRAEWGSSLALLETARPGCVYQTIYEGAIMHPVNQGYQMWWRLGDPTVTKYGATLAALPYGSAIQVGPVRCQMATTAVTCTNWRTGHGIVVSQATYGMF